MTTDTNEKGLEALIVRAMTGRTDLLMPPHVATESAVPLAGGTGWLLGDPRHYDRAFCVCSGAALYSALQADGRSRDFGK